MKLVQLSGEFGPLWVNPKKLGAIEITAEGHRTVWLDGMGFLVKEPLEDLVKSFRFDTTPKPIPKGGRPDRFRDLDSPVFVALVADLKVGKVVDDSDLKLSGRMSEGEFRHARFWIANQIRNNNPVSRFLFKQTGHIMSTTSFARCKNEVMWFLQQQQ